ncbi:MAG: carboxypeptidase regulatory-like domain-containing protein [Deltaproteobacteria bacterium]|nr:MAG: carboxypeptidase regulatory-like domain-containing protein [Deltaproteobacteria bacterium]
MKKWNLIIDVAKCHDCNNCFLSCKDEYWENDFPPYSAAQLRHGHRWINIMRKERGQYPKVDVAYLPIPCMHCEDAPCIKAAKKDAIYKREDGIVVIDPEKAKGQKNLVESCPYGVIYWNEEKSLPQKCTFCVHLLEDGWEQPRCVQACPTGAMSVVYAEDSEMEKVKKSESLEVYQPQYKAKPRVYYKNLYRYTRCFVAGSVALQDIDECAEGAKITLRKGANKVVDKTVTNNYGDFKIDNLEEKSGKHLVEVAYKGYEKKTVEVDVKKSVNLGTIFL